MAWLRVAEARGAPVGSPVTIKGWVRTRRDSKADGGLSFVEVHDGSCFASIQVVARAALPNCQGEVRRLGRGAPSRSTANWSPARARARRSRSSPKP